MSKENIRKWVDALRSGEYKQTTGRLRGDVGFCCLGVACDLYGKEHGEPWVGEGEFMRRIDMPSQAVADWLGVGEPNPVLARLESDDWEDPDAGYTVTPGGDRESDGIGLRASELNDDYGWTFDQIASAIEATYLT